MGLDSGAYVSHHAHEVNMQATTEERPVESNSIHAGQPLVCGEFSSLGWTQLDSPRKGSHSTRLTPDRVLLDSTHPGRGLTRLDSPRTGSHSTRLTPDRVSLDSTHPGRGLTRLDSPRTNSNPCPKTFFCEIHAKNMYGMLANLHGSFLCSLIRSIGNAREVWTSQHVPPIG